MRAVAADGDESAAACPVHQWQNAAVSSVAKRPAFDEGLAARYAKSVFDLEVASISELASERDRNFVLRCVDGRRFVIKAHNAIEDSAGVDCQVRALEILAGAGIEGCPRASRPWRRIPDAEGTACVVRLLTWVDGWPLAKTRPHAPALLEEVGSFVARVSDALGTMDDAWLRREFQWDLRRAREIVAARTRLVSDPGRRRLLERFAADWDERVAPLEGELRESTIHGDANDHNVLVHTDAAGSTHVSGMIDFGDMIHGWRVADAAIAAAYAMLDKRDPWTAACSVIRGFDRITPLDDVELEAVFDLARARLCQSVAIAAAQRREAPDHVYLSVSEAAAWKIVDALASIPHAFAHAAVRAACGREPLKNAARVVAWIDANRASFAPLFAEGVGELADATVLDLSVDSADLGMLETMEDRATFDAWVDRAGRIAIGRYDETRLAYATPAFLVEREGWFERRTVHLGIDVFARAGTAVCAPLEGVVESVADHDVRLDYGPALVLRHETGADAFWTLWGHLDPSVLEALEPGQRIAVGEPFAAIGSRPRNGDWPPHVHVQLVLDSLGIEGSFPGVAAPADRALWTAVSPDPSALLGLDARARAPARGANEELLESRTRRLNPSLSLSYARPLHIVRGAGAYLYDIDGQAYLDLVNNVCHVGHCHPDVVRAAQRQTAVLNTNTRYLHGSILRYAERLAATLPDPLEVCFFTCSGSEANELALRVAASHFDGRKEGRRDERRDVIAIENGYHGNTQTLIDISGYKHDGPGGRGAPDWVHKLAMPDVYRGVHRGPRAAALYVEDFRRLVDALVANGRPPRAFIHESILSCGGQIVLPEEYLACCYEIARSAGAVCIADEVQTGFGRVGSHWWAFETQGVVPDIVTLGKPMGNGHPLAGVVTTRGLAQSFGATGMEYFNTFGGNPVSCEVGAAVLDVIERERLRERAHELGEHILEAARRLMRRCPAIGDVRGRGLFIGIEFTNAQRVPNARHARYVVERMRQRGFLLSTDGPDHNVIKIKPPLVITAADADRFLAALADVLSETAVSSS